MFLFLLLTTLHTLQSGVRTATELRSVQLDKNYYLNQQIPPGIFLGYFSSKGITDSNCQTAILL